MRRGHPVNEGDKPELKEGETYYRHGMGCNYHPDCFTCPYPDCKVGEKQMCTKNTVIARG
jgi:hypothetical protein